MEVGGVDIGFFNKVILEKVYVEDLHKDTLLYAEKLALSIGDINRQTHQIFITSVELKNTKLALITYQKEKDFNLQFIINEFASKDTIADTTAVAWHFRFGGLLLNNVDFKLQDRNDTSTTTGINFSDLHAENIHAGISDVEFFGDTIRATIDNLSTTEKSGFQLRDFACYVKLSPVGMELDQLRIKTAQSEISTDLILKYSKYGDFNDFIHKVKMKAVFTKSRLEMNDIAYFSTDLKGMYKTLTVSGDISGTVNDLRGKNMNILFGDNTQFSGNIDMSGLPNFSETYMHLDINRLTTTREDLEQIPVPPFNEQKTLEVPESIGLLGKIKFSGNFSGFYSDFVAYGKFTTDLGNISSDVDMQKPLGNSVATYSGKIKSDNFDIGKFLGIGILGKISLDGQVDGKGLERDNIAANIKGAIKNIEFNKYNYQNLNVAGNLAKRVFKGMLAVRDTNLSMDFNGDVDFNEKIPVTDFVSTINRADLSALHFIQSKTPAILSSQLTVNVTGSNEDDLLGEALIGKTTFIQNNIQYEMQHLNLVSQKEKDGKKSVFLSSDFLDATIKGNFELSELPTSIINFLNHYAPSYVPKLKLKSIQQPENFNYSVHFNKPNPLTELFFPKLKISPDTYVNGSYNSTDQKIILNAKARQLVLSGKKISLWSAEVFSDQQKIKMKMGCQRLDISDSIGADNLAISATALNDSVTWKLNWKSNDDIEYSGNFDGLVLFDQHPQLKIKLLHSQIVIADSVWKMSEDNEIKIDSSQIAVTNLSFRNGQQAIAVNGFISENKSQAIQINLSQFRLENLNQFIAKSGLKLNGAVDGITTISSIYEHPVFSSSINFQKIKLNNENIGNGVLETLWNDKKQAIYLHGNFSKDSIQNILISGFYYPTRDTNNVDMDMTLHNMEMQIFEPFVKDYCRDFKGQFGGEVTIKGAINNPLLGGKLTLHAKKVTVNYLNTSYSFNQDIIIHPTSFRIDSLVLYDIYGHTAIVNGSVFHNNFKDFQLDFDIEASKFLCLNTSDNTDNLYYGTAFGSGIMNVYGYLNNISIDASLKTEKINFDHKIFTTQLFIPMTGPQEAGDNDFVRFIKKDSVKVKKGQDYKASQNGLTVNLNVEATPDAQVQIIFDSKIGDIITAHGNGNLKMSVNSIGSVSMYGDYTIDDGSYLFTLQNIINKKFKLQKGGTIRWSGDPYNADLNLNAIYQVKTPLSPFFPSDSTGLYKKRYPVNCILNLSGNLFSPNIAFDIDLPTVDDGTRQTIKSYLTTEQEMNKQIFSLMVMNSFVTPDQLKSQGVSQGGNAGTTASSELLSNQLSNWLSQISNDFDVGVNYRPGDLLSSKELEVALSTQLFNDKVSIDGNFGVAGNAAVQTQNTNNIVGDVNIEYKLTEDGKLRVKAFNRSNDNTIVLSNAPFTQGMGIFYREEFNTLGELYRRFRSKTAKQKTTTTN